VFRILGLRWSNAIPKTINRFASELLEEQNDDGGWSQNKGLASDAYATGQTLVALYEAGRLQPKDAPYNRGALFLAGNQKPDGSWQVAKRIAGFQPYFDAKYPHGTDQYISISGACWATMALSLTFPEVSEAKTHTASAR
jgi:squalene cyclase